MMVVMLILSIIMAAFAPVMTTRSKIDLSSPWRYASNNSDIYYGIGDSQAAMIGQRKKKSGDLDSRLVINTSSAVSGQKHILFKSGGDAASSEVLGYLSLDNSNNLILGNGVTSGKYNTSIGKETFAKNTTGTYNTSVGYKSLYSNTEGRNNSSYGASSMYSNISGVENTALGQTSMYSNTSGSENTALGFQSLYKNSTGSGNVAVGNGTLYNSSNSSHNTGLGYRVLFSNTSGAENVGTGFFAMTANDSGSRNVGLGVQALSNNKSGNNNVAVGFQSMQNITSGDNNTAVGYNANNTSLISLTNSTSVGAESTSSDYSTAVGNDATASGQYSTALGNDATASGQYSTALGYYATASGQYSTALGKDAIASDYSSTALGRGAQATGFYSTALGTNTDAAGEYGVAVGNSARAVGHGNTAIGYQACQHVTGSLKTCIGFNSGPYSGDGWGSDSQERIYIGSHSKYNGNSAVLEVHNVTDTYDYDGRRINASGVRINGALVVNGPIINYVKTRSAQSYDWSFLEIKGGKNDDATWSYGSAKNFPLVSDRRLKYVGSENKSGLDKIKQLKVFNYTFKKDKEQTPHVGVIAQDLQKVFPAAVSKDEKGFLSIRLEDIFYALVNSVKELDSKLSSLLKHDNEQDLKIKSLEAENQELKSRLEKLEKSLR